MGAATITRANAGAGRWILGLAVILGLAHWGWTFSPADWGVPAPVHKASGVVLLAVWAGLHASTPARLTAIALLFSAAGDVFLALEPQQLIAGMGAFAVGHVLYAALFGLYLRRNGLRKAGVPLAVLAVIYGAVMLVWLGPRMGELRIPASAYTLIIMTMAILAALARANPLALAGGLLYVVSDSLIAYGLFVEVLAWTAPVIWILYFTGQVCLTVGLVRSAEASP